MAKRLTKEAKAAKALMASARKKGLTGARKNRYVYGIFQRLKLLKGNKLTPRGRSPARKTRRRRRR